MSDDFEVDFDDITPEGMKSLRKAYQKLQADLKTERENSKVLAAESRQRKVADKLEALGAKRGLAEFVRDDVEIDSLGTWLTERADIFGFKVEPQEPDPATAAEAAAQGRISAITPVTPDGGEDPDLLAVKGAQSAAELMQLIYDAQAGKR